MVAELDAQRVSGELRLRLAGFDDEVDFTATGGERDRFGIDTGLAASCQIRTARHVEGQRFRQFEADRDHAFAGFFAVDDGAAGEDRAARNRVRIDGQRAALLRGQAIGAGDLQGEAVDARVIRSAGDGAAGREGQRTRQKAGSDRVGVRSRTARRRQNLRVVSQLGAGGQRAGGGDGRSRRRGRSRDNHQRTGLGTRLRRGRGRISDQNGEGGRFGARGRTGNRADRGQRQTGGQSAGADRVGQRRHAVGAGEAGRVGRANRRARQRAGVIDRRSGNHHRTGGGDDNAAAQRHAAHIVRRRQGEGEGASRVRSAHDAATALQNQSAGQRPANQPPHNRGGTRRRQGQVIVDADRARGKRAGHRDHRSRRGHRSRRRHHGANLGRRLHRGAGVGDLQREVGRTGSRRRTGNQAGGAERQTGRQGAVADGVAQRAHAAGRRQVLRERSSHRRTVQRAGGGDRRHRLRAVDHQRALLMQDGRRRIGRAHGVEVRSLIPRRTGDGPVRMHAEAPAKIAAGDRVEHRTRQGGRDRAGHRHVREHRTNEAADRVQIGIAAALARIGQAAGTGQAADDDPVAAAVSGQHLQTTDVALEIVVARARTNVGVGQRRKHRLADRRQRKRGGVAATANRRTRQHCRQPAVATGVREQTTARTHIGIELRRIRRQRSFFRTVGPAGIAVAGDPKHLRIHRTRFQVCEKLIDLRRSIHILDRQAQVCGCR